jgi:hypothetical protein
MVCQEHLPQAYLHHQAANDHSILCAALSTDPGEEKKRHTTRAPYKSQMEPNLQKERKAIYHFSAEFDFSNFSLELAMTDFNPRQG